MRARRHRTTTISSVDVSSPHVHRPPIGPVDSPFVRFLPKPSPKALSSDGIAELENISAQLKSPPRQAAAAAGVRGVALRPKSAKAPAGGTEMAEALRELADRGEEWGGDEEWSREKELEYTRGIAAKVKKPTPPCLHNRLNVFIGGSVPSALEAPKALAAPDWEALPAGTRLQVFWAGNEEYFECTIKSWHVAIGAEGKLFYTHRCEYDGGTFDHDLSRVQFEVIEVAACNTERRVHGAADGLSSPHADGDASQPSDTTTPMSPRRKWLAQQEVQLQQLAEDLEQADISTPLSGEAARLRGRMVLRRFRLPGGETPRAAQTPRSPRSPRAADESVLIVDPSDVAVTYRLPVGATPARSVRSARPTGTA